MIETSVAYCAASLGNPPELVLGGHKDALLDVAKLVQHGGQAICGPTPPGCTYPVRLSVLRVVHTHGDGVSVQVKRDETTLEVKGPPSKLNVLANVIRDLAVEGSAGDHVHIEYVPDHFYLAPESMPLVVQREAS